MMASIERAERHGWTIWFHGQGHAHLERRDTAGRLYLISVDEDGTVALYGEI